jgi:misacylated tRNA(Ala) deacylase
MVKALYMDDSYLREWDAVVESVSQEKFIILDKTAFFPKGGGVEYDIGTLTTEDKQVFNVVYTGKFSGKISHEVEKAGLQEGDKVHCLLDWERRYLLMRYHTATHVLSGVLFKDYNLKVTGNQLTTDKARVDLNMAEMDVNIIIKSIEKSNEIIEKKLKAKTLKECTLQ